MKHPFQILTSDEAGHHLFASNQNQIQVFDLSSGDLIGHWSDDYNSTPTHSQIDNKKSKVPILNYIRYLALTPNETILVACTDSDKSILTFSIDYNSNNCLSLLKRQVMVKRPSSLSVNNDIITVADKFGDVYEVKLDSTVLKESEMEPILGHVSMLLDVQLVKHQDSQFLITCDRDEHIRVSNYPKSYVIKDFLLNHKCFVSKLHIPQVNSNYLVSGGGDPYICLWNWYTGEMMQKIEVGSVVEQYLDEFHSPPERFRKEGIDQFEICISQISSMNDYLIVLVEHTSVLVVFKFENCKYELCQVVNLESYIIDFTICSNTVVVSLDSDNCPLASLHLTQGQLIPETNPQVMDKIVQSITIDVESKEQFQQLYPLSTLRKRKEN